jgi:hypothetical protein
MRLTKATLIMTENETRLRLGRMQRKIPVEIYKRLGPLLGKQAQRNAQRMAKTM